MWPFKRKPAKVKEQPAFTSVLCIPGPWKDDLELKLALVKATDGEYIAAGGVMMNTKSKFHNTIEFCTRDERMKESFSIAGKITGITDNLLHEINDHKSVVYITAPTGNSIRAREIALAGAALLSAGGIGLKVESAGKAFEKEAWLTLANNPLEGSLYEMFVVDSLMMPDGTVFSCGMQNLGLRDCIISGIPFQESTDVLRILGFYQLLETPDIAPGQTFTSDVSSPIYRFSEEANAPYKGDELFGNPFGMWRLELISGT